MNFSSCIVQDTNLGFIWRPPDLGTGRKPTQVQVVEHKRNNMLHTSTGKLLQSCGRKSRARARSKHLQRWAGQWKGCGCQRCTLSLGMKGTKQSPRELGPSGKNPTRQTETPGLKIKADTEEIIRICFEVARETTNSWIHCPSSWSASCWGVLSLLADPFEPDNSLLFVWMAPSSFR